MKNDFPLLKNGKLAYLDSAATSQKPKQVIKALVDFYESENANIHRGVYELSENATEKYEAVRHKTAKFINAKSPKEIIFTRNATEAINLVAYTFGQSISKGDEIIVSALEHHSNLVPWQELCKRKKATLKVIPLKADLTLDFNAYKKLLTEKTRLVAVTAMSNVLGTVTPIEEITKLAHKKGALVLVDGAQFSSHNKTDVQKLGADFFAISAHKMFGPTGVGVLYGKQELLEDLPPFLYGGDMIYKVNQLESTYAPLPAKFEAGTPNIAGVIAFGAALDYITQIGFRKIQSHDKELYNYAIKTFKKYPQVKMFLPPKGQAVISFTIEGIHPHDIASIFNEYNVAIRAGHHCAHPLMQTLKIPATARMSFHLYNTKEDIDQAEKALQKALSIFG